MEGLILAIIIGLVTSFFNKKEDKKASPTKPFMPQAPPPETTQAHRKLVPRKSVRPKIEVKSLEDFARDVMTQLSTKEQPKAAEVTQSVEHVQAADVKQPTETTRSSMDERLKERQQTVRVVESSSSSFEVPASHTQLQQAIIMAEVLGKPKSKQRK